MTLVRDKFMSFGMIKTLLLFGYCFLMVNVSRVNAQSELTGKWKLTGYSFISKQAFPVNTMKIALTISDNKIGGNSGCNIFGGDITIARGGKIKVGSLTSTDMFCDEIKGEFENLFLDTIQNAASYTLKKGVLTISAPTKKSFLRFERFKEPAKKATTVEKQKSVFISEPLVKK